MPPVPKRSRTNPSALASVIFTARRCRKSSCEAGASFARTRVSIMLDTHCTSMHAVRLCALEHVAALDVLLHHGREPGVQRRAAYSGTAAIQLTTACCC